MSESRYVMICERSGMTLEELGTMIASAAVLGLPCHATVGMGTEISGQPVPVFRLFLPPDVTEALDNAGMIKKAH